MPMLEPMYMEQLLSKINPLTSFDHMTSDRHQIVAYTYLRTRPTAYQAGYSAGKKNPTGTWPNQRLR